MRTAARAACGLATCLLLSAAAMAWSCAVAAQQFPVEEQEAPDPPRAEPVKRLRLMLVDLADLRLPEDNSAFEAGGGTYRHTFGSQRKTVEEIEPVVVSPEALEADVVVIRGLKEMRAARRLFPARDWRMLLGREKPGERRTSVDDPRAGRSSTSAVALWLQPGVRFGGADPGLQPGLGAAMRVVSGLGTLWVLAASEACRETPSTAGGLCKPLEDWIATKLAGGDLVLVGGLLPALPGGAKAQTGRPEPPATAGDRKPPARAQPMAPRHWDGIVQLTGADAAGRCGGDAQSGPALHLRIAQGSSRPPGVTGFVLPIEPPKPPPGPASRPAPPPRAAACVLLLDLEAAP
jgi:hypothetical protein